ncbi:MAG: ABC transporter permease [delta proteobacterium ML8_F1]|nr:MAG: ABC transporter permease [delta proteobacterium ML8_F1]
MPRLRLKVLGNENWQWISIPLLSVFFAILTGSAVVLLMGKSPVDTYLGILQGAGFVPKANYAGGTGMLTDFMSFLDAMAPMLFAALGVTVAFKAGLFNIGISGQMLAGGFLATVLIGYSDLPWMLAKPLVLVIAGTAGALAGGFIGYLKYRFNINEVVSSIMTNYILAYLISFIINTAYVNPVSRQSEYINPSAALTIKGVSVASVKVNLSIGIILALLAAILLHYLINKTRLGFEIKAVGANRKGAQYAGINIGRTMVTAMMISGALAGLAGATFYLGYFTSIQPGVLSGLGFNAIATSLLGNISPLGVILSSILITILDKGATFMSSKVGVVKEISGVITSLILLFSAMGAYFRYLIAKKQPEYESGGEEEAHK